MGRTTRLAPKLPCIGEHSDQGPVVTARYAKQLWSVRDFCGNALERAASGALIPFLLDRDSSRSTNPSRKPKGVERRPSFDGLSGAIAPNQDSQVLTCESWYHMICSGDDHVHDAKQRESFAR
jgi:hypothetical protein